MDCDSSIVYILKASTVEMSLKRKNKIYCTLILNQTRGMLLLVEERKAFNRIHKQEALL